MEFNCGTINYVWRGAAILPWKTTDKMASKVALKFAEDHGHQNVEAFEGEPKAVMSASIAGTPYEQGALLLTLELSNKEKTEINLLH
jgi:hypothetical protein